MINLIFFPSNYITSSTTIANMKIVFLFKNAPKIWYSFWLSDLKNKNFIVCIVYRGFPQCSWERSSATAPEAKKVKSRAIIKGQGMCAGLGVISRTLPCPLPTLPSVIRSSGHPSGRSPSGRTPEITSIICPLPFQPIFIGKPQPSTRRFARQVLEIWGRAIVSIQDPRLGLPFFLFNERFSELKPAFQNT